MKPLFTSLILFLLFSVGLNAQNYRMMNANSEYFFTANGNNWPTYLPDEVFGLKCDSTQGNFSDSTYFPYRTIVAVLPADSACSVDPNYPIWAGSKIVITNNNRHSFRTISGDSLIINTQTNPGDTQQIYLYGNGNRIIAIHSSNTQMTFAAITDSVKNYFLQIRNPANTVVPGYWNGKTIIVSKNNGVVQMPAVLNFPNDTFLFSRVAAKRLRYGDLYPWQPGDELHEYASSFNQMSFYGSNWTYNKFILSRTMINADSVVFTMRLVTHYTSNAPPANTITIDTINFGVGRLNSYVENKMPQQTIDSLRTYDLFLQPSDCGKLRMVDHTQNAFYISYPTPCVQENNFEPMFHDNIYIDGVAGYYFHDFPSAQNNVTESQYYNLYYYIESVSCGTPLYLGTQELLDADFHVWPNPTNDFLNFDLPENNSGFLFEIFDLSGKEIRTVSLGKNSPVDVKFLADGFYFGKIISSDGNNQRIIRFVKN